MDLVFELNKYAKNCWWLQLLRYNTRDRQTDKGLVYSIGYM